MKKSYTVKELLEVIDTLEDKDYPTEVYIFSGSNKMINNIRSKKLLVSGYADELIRDVPIDILDTPVRYFYPSEDVDDNESVFVIRV